MRMEGTGRVRGGGGGCAVTQTAADLSGPVWSAIGNELVTAPFEWDGRFLRCRLRLCRHAALSGCGVSKPDITVLMTPTPLRPARSPAPAGYRPGASSALQNCQWCRPGLGSSNF
jgi:hypothetical protein